jgi:hypothetical protein
MRNRVFINMIVKGHEVWQHRKRVQDGQDRTRKQNNNYKHCEKGQRGKRAAVHKIHVNKVKVR